jgi:hypothetical protein
MSKTPNSPTNTSESTSENNSTTNDNFTNTWKITTHNIQGFNKPEK